MSKKKVLLVDDEESLCRVLKLNLEETGNYEVRAETKGTSALNAAMEFGPDIIVLDFIMPDIDGGDIAQQLQENSKTKNIPIIFLTAVATKDDTKDQGAVIGGHFVIAKPITLEQLTDSIERKLKEKDK